MVNKKVFVVLQMSITVFAVLWVMMAVIMFNVRSENSVEKKYIQYEIDVKNSKYVQKGWSIWLKQGQKGYKYIASRTTWFGNKKVKQDSSFESEIIQKPKKGIMIRGTSNTKHPITVPKTTYVHRIHNVEATAYDPSPESNGLDWAGITALGWRTRFGIAAVDPRVIALRTLIYVDGYGFAWTGDTGGDIKGKRIDLCYNTTEEALRYGRRKAKVYVLGRRPSSYYAKKKR